MTGRAAVEISDHGLEIRMTPNSGWIEIDIWSGERSRATVLVQEKQAAKGPAAMLGYIQGAREILGISGGARIFAHVAATA